MMDESKTTIDWVKRFKILTICLCFLAIIIAGILLANNHWNFLNWQSSKQTTLPNTIYLLITPIITIAAVIVTYLAFLMQKKANDMISEDQKRRAIDEGKRAIDEERRAIEEQFHTMLRLHRENVNDLCYRKSGNENDKTKGKQYFSLIKADLHLLYGFINDFQKDIDTKNKMKLAYELLFNGLELYRSKRYHLSYNSIFHKSLVREFNDLTPQNTEIAVYIRHLYQTTKFIANQDESKGIINYQNKRNYLRILRAQLSTDEQVMLFYNWHAEFGSQWEQKKTYRILAPNHFFTDYRMIHNIFPNLMIEEIGNSLLNGQIINFKNPNIKTEKDRSDDHVFEFEEW